MKVWIDGIDVFQLAVEQIICCDWLITFQSCPVQGLLACWPLTAKPRLELVAPALPCLCNFIVRSFQLTGFSNPFHIYWTRLLQNSFQAIWQRLQTLSRVPGYLFLILLQLHRSELTCLQHHLDSLVNSSLLIGVGIGQPTQQTPWIVLQLLACSSKHPLNGSQAQQPVHNSLPTTNQSCWGSTAWSGRSTSQIGQWGAPEILCLWVWSVVWPLVAHSQEPRYHAKQKSMVYPLAFSAQTPRSAAPCFSPLWWLAWSVKGLRYIQGNDKDDTSLQ